jgi:hypothetical protein
MFLEPLWTSPWSRDRVCPGRAGWRSCAVRSTGTAGRRCSTRRRTTGCKTRLSVTLGSIAPGGMSWLIHRWIEAKPSPRTPIRPSQAQRSRTSHRCRVTIIHDTTIGLASPSGDQPRPYKCGKRHHRHEPEHLEKLRLPGPTSAVFRRAYRAPVSRNRGRMVLGANTVLPGPGIIWGQQVGFPTGGQRCRCSM